MTDLRYSTNGSALTWLLTIETGLGIVALMFESPADFGQIVSDWDFLGPVSLTVDFAFLDLLLSVSDDDILMAFSRGILV